MKIQNSISKNRQDNKLLENGYENTKKKKNKSMILKLRITMIQTLYRKE